MHGLLCGRSLFRRWWRHEHRHFAAGRAPGRSWPGGAAGRGVLLVVLAMVALGWANSPWAGAYESLRAVRFGPAGLHLDLSVRQWAADGLLAVFFVVVGNGLRQEFVNGELRNPRRAVLPIVAALGGVAVPATGRRADQPHLM
ncbi:Na+/H+ antiporter NhaA [Actinoplanes sp. NEAU-A12]|uniref:Na+/H+ antiporter NhaA n=1 Tax=Actinoplanes sandaracinus TaxID=3045177 RepID=A0ABT6WYH0_9ACTN|nr:Na+/H+ antiporter NhaA [Actinoplanes sandaracinus]MDI6104782.1 Na+/H+ antiporter NhaA [Actinoplanes sandaracinus]